MPTYTLLIAKVITLDRPASKFKNSPSHVSELRTTAASLLYVSPSFIEAITDNEIINMIKLSLKCLLRKIGSNFFSSLFLKNDIESESPDNIKNIITAHPPFIKNALIGFLISGTTVPSTCQKKWEATTASDAAPRIPSMWVTRVAFEFVIIVLLVID